MDHEIEIVRDIQALHSDMQTLVYENYNKFISATDTIRKVPHPFIFVCYIIFALWFIYFLIAMILCCGSGKNSHGWWETTIIHSECSDQCRIHCALMVMLWLFRDP
jgi:hypothetical protein